MPKLKINRVISFSSEDTIHKAANILSANKWKCSTKGEKSASLILQLEEASTISSIDIGNEHSAYIEVLVKRSGGTSDFKVLLVMSSFMSPLESRQSTNINKVRMFGYNDFQSPERDEKWDVVKVVCTQPFNRHVQYGLSFITLHTPENKGVNVTGAVMLGNSSEKKEGEGSAIKLGKFTLRPNSPNSLTTGSLFARRNNPDTSFSPSAAASIRDSSSTISPSCKTPKLKIAARPSTSPCNVSLNTSTDTSKQRNRKELLYSKDEENTHHKIDNLMKMVKKETEEKQTAEVSQKKPKQKKNNANEVVNGKQASPMPTTSHAKKRKHNDSSSISPKKMKVQKLSKPFHKLLEGVTIVISGIENPERSTIRNEALEMGASYKRDWDQSCTHLVCAFTNTPKFHQVKGKGKIVNRLWVSDCHAQRKRLPWRRYALDRNDLVKNESEDEICETSPSSSDVTESYNCSSTGLLDNSDTEDEIEIVAKISQPSTLVRSCYSVDTDEEIIKLCQDNEMPELPSILSHKKLYIDDELTEEEKKLLNRYIVALNGTVLDVPAEVDFIITTSKNVGFLKEICSTAHAVTSDWVWDCYNENKLIPVNAFEL